MEKLFLNPLFLKSSFLPLAARTWRCPSGTESPSFCFSLSLSLCLTLFSTLSDLSVSAHLPRWVNPPPERRRSYLTGLRSDWLLASAAWVTPSSLRLLGWYISEQIRGWMCNGVFANCIFHHSSHKRKNESVWFLRGFGGNQTWRNLQVGKDFDCLENMTSEKTEWFLDSTELHNKSTLILIQKTSWIGKLTPFWLSTH